MKKKRARKSDAYIGGKELRPESLMMTYGYDPALSEGSVKTPIFQTSTFVFKNAEAGKSFFEMAYGLREAAPGEAMGLIYSRINNPDLEVLEDRLTLWEDAEACAVFASGMAAITTMLMEFLSPGDVLLHSEPLYGGTDHFIKHVLPRFQITPICFAAGATRAEVDAALAKHAKSGKLAMVYLETPANPTNAQVDIAMCASIAKAHSTKGRKVLVAVDNTFLGPLWQQPFEHGADLVLYSATKFLGGHSDLIGGACLGPKDLMSRVKAMRTFLGTMASPHTCWLLLRSLETLKLRMTSQMKNARYVADYLLAHPKVARVYYLGHLEGGHARARALPAPVHRGRFHDLVRCEGRDARGVPAARRAHADQTGGEPGRHGIIGRASGEHDARRRDRGGEGAHGDHGVHGAAVDWRGALRRYHRGPGAGAFRRLKVGPRTADGECDDADGESDTAGGDCDV